MLSLLLGAAMYGRIDTGPGREWAAGARSTGRSEQGRKIITALVPPDGWTASLAEAAASPVKARGAAPVRAFIAAWEDPATAAYLRSVILTAAHEPAALQHLATNFARYILQAVSAHLGDADRLTRASLVSAQMVGLAMTRYVWKVGAIAQMPAEDVVRYIAPTIQRYLTGKLGS